MIEHPGTAENGDLHVTHTSNHWACPTTANHRTSLSLGTRLPATALGKSPGALADDASQDARNDRIGRNVLGTV
jgi:hypothetical protein